MASKTLKLDGLDCAHCAAEIEEAVNELTNVEASLSFMTQKMVVKFEDGNFDDVLAKIEKIVGKIEPDVILSVE